LKPLQSAENTTEASRILFVMAGLDGGRARPIVLQTNGLLSLAVSMV
jgi:hypothetical protein